MVNRRNPIVLFTLDAGDSDFIKQWCSEGFLPNIAKIIENGWLKTFSDGELLNEIGSWPSLLSGLSKTEHHYSHLRTLIPGTYRLRSTNATMFQETIPFWCHLAGSDRTVLIVDPPDRDVYPNVPGLQVAHWTPHQSERMPKKLQAMPAALLDELLPKYNRYTLLQSFRRGSTFQTDVDQLNQARQSIAMKGQLCSDLIRRDEFDLVVIGFNETHNLGHRMWSYQKEYAGENELTFAIRDVYAGIDKQIGLLLKQMPEQTNVFVTSTYGMLALYPMTGLMTSFVRNLGYQVSKHDSNNSCYTNKPGLVSTIGRAISAKLPVSLQEHSISKRLETETDWSRTRAYTIDSLYTGLIRINLKGREPQGIVERQDYQTVIDEIEHDFKLLTDPVTGKSPIQRIVRTCEIFDCEPHPVLPDVFVEWTAATHARMSLEHPKTTLTQMREHYDRSSWHSSTGFLAASGPAIDPHESIPQFKTLDIAPTMLALLDVPIPAKLKGAPFLGSSAASTSAPNMVNSSRR